MEYRKITSNEDWRDLWFTKFVAELETRDLLKDDVAFYGAVMKEFLTAFSGNPREIDMKKMTQFVKKQKGDAVPPLMLFYTSVARSEKHCEALGAIRQTVLPQKKSTSKQDKA
jgi:hypothetical protein